MKKFIKITDTNNHEHYLNVDYILKFHPLNEKYNGNTMIFLGGGEKVVTIQTSTTCEEIIDMIELTNN